MDTMIADVRDANFVLRFYVQAPFHPEQCKIIGYRKTAIIEQHVMIGAET